jgi:hypothetical protein
MEIAIGLVALLALVLTGYGIWGLVYVIRVPADQGLPEPYEPYYYPLLVGAAFWILFTIGVVIMLSWGVGLILNTLWLHW